MQLVGRRFKESRLIERLSDVVDAQPEGSDNEVDQLPLPPVAGEVSFQSVDFRFGEGNLLVAKMSALRFQLVPLSELLGAVEVVKAQS